MLTVHARCAAFFFFFVCVYIDKLVMFLDTEIHPLEQPKTKSISRAASQEN